MKPSPGVVHSRVTDVLDKIFQIFKVILIFSLVITFCYSCIDSGLNRYKDDIIANTFALEDKTIFNQAQVEQIQDPKAREMTAHFQDSYVHKDLKNLSAIQKKFADECFTGEMCNSANEACVSVWECSKASYELYGHIDRIPSRYKDSSASFAGYMNLYKNPPVRIQNMTSYVFTGAFFSLLMLFGLGFVFESMKSRKRDQKISRVKNRYTRALDQKQHYRVPGIAEMSPQNLRRVVDLRLLEAEEEAEALETAELLEKQTQANPNH